MRIFFSVVLLFVSQYAFGQLKDKITIYKALESSSVAVIDKLLNKNTWNGNDNEGYIGALQMRKAALITNAKEKLSLFKQGHAKLEHAISVDSTNTELRFLRLIIQEHAPAFLRYNRDIDKDCLYIRNHYKQLSPAIRQIIIDYSQTSVVLKLLSS